MAWTIGGSLLIASALFPLVAQGVFLPGLGVLSAGLYAASLLVLALGVRGQGSVVARRPLGVTALVVAALVPIASTVFWGLVPLPPDGADWAVPLNQGVEVLLLGSLLVATVQIARAGVVPAGARWLPLIVVVVAAAAQILVTALFVAVASGVGDFTALLALVALIGAVAPLLLGIVAIVLASRAGRTDRGESEPVQVFPPAG